MSTTAAELPPGSKFSYVGSSLSLDFVNTVANRLDPTKRRELFTSIDDVAVWATMSSLQDQLDEKWVNRLRRESNALSRVVRVRDSIHEVLSSTAVGRAIASASVAVLDAAVRRCRGQRRLEPAGLGLAWRWMPGVPASDELLAPLLEDVIDLLSEPHQHEVRRCEGAGCGWLFADRSPAQRRRWCSMADCGNRAKARRHYQAGVQERLEEHSLDK